jgi:hypothetical protein
MATTLARVRLVLGLALLLVGVACDDTPSSVGPTALSNRGGAPAGAVITGSVSGVAPAPVSTNLLAPSAANSLRVTIEGTTISTTVDSSGQFTLTGVPRGTVTLTFSGPGVSASITLANVSEGEEIRIEVRLNGSSARIVSESHRDRDDDDDDKHQIKGSVSGLTGACPAITFTVGTRTVKTTSTTVFDDPCSRILNNVRVEVEGTLAADGTFMARRVEIDE